MQEVAKLRQQKIYSNYSKERNNKALGVYMHKM